MATLVVAVVTVGCSAADGGPSTDTTEQPIPATTSTSSPAPDVSVPPFPSTTTVPPTSSTTVLDPGGDARRRQGSEDCISEPGALQDILDGTPDGEPVTDMKGKLVDAAELGFVVIDLSGLCFEDQGTISLIDRRGLWIVQADTRGSDWVLASVADTVLSGIDLNGGSMTITGGNQRIEAGAIHDLTLTAVTDFMMGSMDITGSASFEAMHRETDGQSFVRNSTFNELVLRGLMTGFSITASTVASLEDLTEPGSDLRLDLGG